MMSKKRLSDFYLAKAEWLVNDYNEQNIKNNWNDFLLFTYFTHQAI